MPLFWPNPTMLSTRLGPAPPRSKSGLLGTGQFGFGPEEVMHATVQVSLPCSFFPHLICPVFTSKARAASKKSSGAVQSFLGCVFLQCSPPLGAPSLFPVPLQTAPP